MRKQVKSKIYLVTMMDKTLIPSSWTTPMDNQMNYTELDGLYQRGATL